MKKIIQKYKKNNFLRWISVLPLSFLSGLLLTFPLHFILYYVLGRELFRPIEIFLSPIVVMTVFILVGYKIAPKYKLQTSIILTILWIVFFLSTLIFMPETVKLDTRTLFTFLGILFALYINWNKSKKLTINS